jgi:hypothetical protein
LNDFYKYENSFFEACFKYPNILLFKTSKPLTNDDEVPELIHYKDLFTNPEKGYLSAFEMPDFHHTSLTNQMSLLKFLPYIVDVEHLVTRFLTSLNEDLRRFEEKFKSNLSRGALLNVVEGYRLELIRLLNNWNLKFLNKVATKFPNEKDIKNILRNYLHTRIDARLLNLRIAKKFFDCYELVKNYEKGYLLLSRAFEDNKKIIDIYLDTYIKYECEKPLMYHFLNNPLDLSFETVKSWEWKSIYFWIDCFDTLHKRNPYVKFLLDDLEQFLSLNQIIEILEVLAEYGFKTSNYYQSEKYYENLLYIYDNVDKMQMIKEHFSTKVDSAEENFGSKTKESIPRSRALRNLELNKKYVRINNEIIKVSNCNCNFEKALSYIANNVFLYYNSLMMINDTDPNKYPKKGGEDIILLDQANYTSSVTTNSNFQNILAFFNWEFKRTIELRKDVWVSVNNKFDIVNGKLYKAVKNCIDTLQKFSKFNVDSLWEFIESYVPNFVADRKFDKSFEYYMDMYYPSYTGVIEHKEYERWILTKLKFLNHRLRINGNELHTQRLKKQPNYAKATKSSSCKDTESLKENDIKIYFSLQTHFKEFVHLLFTKCLYHSYLSCSPSSSTRIVQSFKSRFEFRDDQPNNLLMYLEDISNPSFRVLSSSIARFVKKVDSILKLRKRRAEESKNIIRSFRDKFVLEHHRIDKQTECNILVMLKNIQDEDLSSKIKSKPSRFSKEYAHNYDFFHGKLQLSQLHDIPDTRQIDRKPMQRLVKQVLKNKEAVCKVRPYSKSVDRIKSKPSLFTKVTEGKFPHYSIIDRYQIATDIKGHYYNFVLKEKRSFLGREQVILEKQKETGPEIHIDDSILEINNTLFMFQFHQGGITRKSHCNINIHDDNIALKFRLWPGSPLKSAATTITLNLEKNLVDFKEEILKELDIKFQSCYPIIYQLVANENFKHVFCPPGKSKEVAIRAGVSENITVALLNSMAFLYPIILTELRFYPGPVMDKFSLTYFTKYDLDSAQCLCMLFFLLSHLLVPLTINKKVGRVLCSQVDLKKFLKISGAAKLNLLVLYLVQKNMESYIQMYKSRLLQLFLDVPATKEDIHKWKTFLSFECLMPQLEHHQALPDEAQPVRSSLTFSTAKLYLDNFYNYLRLGKIYQAAQPGAKSKDEKADLFYKEKRLIATRVFKGSDGVLYQINLFMLVNMNDYKNIMTLFKTCVDKFEQMNSVSKTNYKIEEFLLFAWILVCDKFFGFCVTIDNFYKHKIKYLKEHPKIIKTKKINQDALSIIELPKVYHNAEREFITFSQMMWMLTKGRGLVKEGRVSTEYTQAVTDLGKAFVYSHVLACREEGLPGRGLLLQSFLSKHFDQREIKSFWNSPQALPFIEPFLFEHAKINELLHDSDGIVNKSTTKLLLRFNYDKFNRIFSLSNEHMIQAIIPQLMSNSSSIIQIQYLNSFVNVFKLLAIKQDLREAFSSNKRIYDVDKVIDAVDQRVELEKHVTQEKRRPELELAVASKERSKETTRDSLFNQMFDKNFKEVKNLISNDFHGEAGDLVLQANTNVERIRQASFIVKGKQDITFSFDKLQKKRKPIITKSHLTENLEEAEKFYKRMIEFNEKIRNMHFSFGIDVNGLFSRLKADHRARATEIHGSYDLLLTINDRKGWLGRNQGWGERGFFKMKLNFVFANVPFESYTDYVKLCKIKLGIYYPLLKSQATLEIEEPCFMVKLIRIISLASIQLRDLELSALIGPLLVRHHPKNTFNNVELAINSSFHTDDKHFYITVLRFNNILGQKPTSLQPLALNSRRNISLPYNADPPASSQLNLGLLQRDSSQLRYISQLGLPSERDMYSNYTETDSKIGSLGRSEMLNYDPDTLAAHKIIQLQKKVDDDEEKKVRRLKKEFELIPTDSALFRMDGRIRLQRLSFKLHNVFKEADHDVETYRVIKNVEGYLNTTFQKSINNQKAKVTHISELPQEKVKERLLINDPASKNSLIGMSKCREDIISFIQPIQGLGNSHVRTSLFYSKIDYKSKTINGINEGEIEDLGSTNPGRIQPESLYEDLCARIRTIGSLLTDQESFSSLDEATEKIPELFDQLPKQYIPVLKQKHSSRIHNFGSAKQSSGQISSQRDKLLKEVPKPKTALKTLKHIQRFQRYFPSQALEKSKGKSAESKENSKLKKPTVKDQKKVNFSFVKKDPHRQNPLSAKRRKAAWSTSNKKERTSENSQQPEVEAKAVEPDMEDKPEKLRELKIPNKMVNFIEHSEEENVDSIKRSDKSNEPQKPFHSSIKKLFERPLSNMKERIVKKDRQTLQGSLPRRKIVFKKPILRLQVNPQEAINQHSSSVLTSQENKGPVLKDVTRVRYTLAADDLKLSMKLPRQTQHFDSESFRTPLLQADKRVQHRSGLLNQADKVVMSSVEETSKFSTHKLFKKEEALLLSIQLIPINFKYREYKIILNAQDINQIIDMREFFQFAFQTKDPAQLNYKLGIINPKLAFVNLLRYIVMKIEMKKASLFRVPCFRKLFSDKTVYLKNIFNKYEHNTNIVISGFLDKVSGNNIVIYSGVIRSKGTYLVVTVSLNRAINLFQLKVYNPRVLRTFLMELDSKWVLQHSQEYFLNTVFPTFIRGNLSQTFASYQAFHEQTRTSLNSKKKIASMEALDEVSAQDNSPKQDSKEENEKRNLLGVDSGKSFDTPRASDRSNPTSFGGFFSEAVDQAKTRKKNILKDILKESPRHLLKQDKSFGELFILVEEFMDDPIFLRLFSLWDTSISNSKLTLHRPALLKSLGKE